MQRPQKKNFRRTGWRTLNAMNWDIHNASIFMRLLGSTVQLSHTGSPKMSEMKTVFWILRIKSLYAPHVYRSGRSARLYTKEYQRDKGENNDLALVSPAFFLLFARQDCAPVVILEFLLSFFYLSILEIGIISVAPTVMSFSLDCLFLMTFFILFFVCSALVAVAGNANHTLFLFLGRTPTHHQSSSHASDF